MPSDQVTALLGEWEGYRVGFIERRKAEADGGRAGVFIELIPRADPTPILPPSVHAIFLTKAPTLICATSPTCNCSSTETDDNRN